MRTASLSGRFIFVAGCAAIIITLSRGIRQVFGLFLYPISVDLSLDRGSFGFALALQSIVIGLCEPLTGALADKFGAARVLIIGSLAYGGGLSVMAQASGPFDLNLGAGLMVGFGASAAGFAVVLGAVGRLVSPERRGIALGLTTAGGSIGQFVLPPLTQLWISSYGWSGALLVLALLAALVLPLALAFSKAPAAVELPSEEAPTVLSSAVREAVSQRAYQLLSVGFFVCGFHVSFIAVHLPAYLGDVGLSPPTAARALALIGFFNIIGTTLFGFLADRFSRTRLLAGLYFMRAVVIFLFMFAPASEAAVLIFAAAMGLLWLATVPLTSGLVAHIFGVRYMATLFGIVYLSHQAGAFFGAWLGGIAFDFFGSYQPIWGVAVLLGLLSALCHLPIRETPLYGQSKDVGTQP